MRKFLLTNRLKLVILICLSFGLFLTAGSGTVLADPFTYDYDFTSMDELVVDDIHDDIGLPNSEAKGSATFTFTNNTSQAWGDFHFKINSGTAIFDPTQTPEKDDVAFAPGNYILSNGNQNLDLYFYGDAVGIGQQVKFKIYTDNTYDQGFFGMCFLPSAVPVPGAIWLFGSGLIGLLGIKKKFKKF